MKKGFQVIGILTLLFGSFVYSNEVSMTSKQSDFLFDLISSKASLYESDGREAIISSDTIISGKASFKVDVYKSYDKMREVGYFNDKLLVYKKSYPTYRLRDNLDKYVVGSSGVDKEIGLVIMAFTSSDLSKIIDVLNKANVNVSIFITSGYLERNYNQVMKFISSGHTIGSLGNDGDYFGGDFIWMKTIITNTSQKNSYCLVKERDKEVLDVCRLQNSYTIMPTIIDKNPYINVKDNLKSGNIVAFSMSSSLEDELLNIINYIKGKGFKIVPLDVQLQE